MIKIVKQTQIDTHQAVTQNSDIQEEHSFVFDADSKTSVSNVDQIEALLYTNVTGPVETINLESKSLSDLDSTGKSALLELSTLEEATSEFTETAVFNNKSESETEITLTSVEVSEGASLGGALIKKCAVSFGIVK